MSIATIILLGVGCTDKTVQVINTPPSVSITSPADGTEYQEYETIEFYATVNDSQQSAETLTLSWVSDLDGIISEEPADSSGNAILLTANLSSGNHTISLNAVDDKATSGMDYVEISVIDTEDDPSLTIRHPQPDEFGVEDEPTYFEVVVSDAQDDLNALLVVIESDVDGELCADYPDESGLFVCDAPLTIGDHSLLFTVLDSSDNIVSEAMLYTVLPLTEVDNDGDGYSESEGDCDDTDSSVYPTGTEYPNEIDDDCDGTIDESPVSNATNCCDTMQCFSRSSCDAGECIPLPLGVCNFDGDCPNGMNCQDNQCVPNEPTEPSSCESPITVSFLYSNDVSGNSSYSRRSRLNSGCMVFSTEPIGQNEGYEVVYYLDYPLGIIRPYTFTAAVRVNGVAIPITFSVFSDCQSGTESLISCNTNYGRNASPEDIEVELVLARGRPYYLVIDTLDNHLQEEMIRQSVGFDHVTYELSLE